MKKKYLAWLLVVSLSLSNIGFTTLAADNVADVTEESYLFHEESEQQEVSEVDSNASLDTNSEAGVSDTEAGVLDNENGSVDTAAQSDTDSQSNIETQSDAESQMDKTSQPDPELAAKAEEERATSEDELGYIPGQILISYDSNQVSEEEIAEVTQEKDATVSETIEVTEDTSIAVVDISDDMTVDAAVEEIEQEEKIVAAQPNYILDSFEDEEAVQNVTAVNDERSTQDANDERNTQDANVDLSTPDANSDLSTQNIKTNDSYLGNQWYLDRINTEEAWNIVQSANPQKVKVAILDTGADYTHEDLSGIIDMDLSKQATDTGFTSLSASDPATHGTHVTGIVGANANNGKGVTGVASTENNNVLDLFVVGVSMNDKILVSTVIRAIEYAVNQGANVINMSLGSTTNADMSVFENACDAAYKSDVTIVCAAGNENTTDRAIPGDFDSTISVINMNQSNDRASTSNYGSTKDLSAPGTLIYSVIPDGLYAYMSGTSMAAPMVTAAVALMKSVNPSLTPDQIRSILRDTAMDIGAAGYDEQTGAGCLDVGAAVAAAKGNSDSGNTGDAGNSDTGNTDGAEKSDTGNTDGATAGVEQRANVVVFVRFADSTMDNFMAEIINPGAYGETTGTKAVDKMYDGNGAMGGETSERCFTKFISKVSRGKVQVVNDFPQYDEASANIIPFTASHEQSYYLSNDYALVEEAIAYVNQNTTKDYDLNSDGVIDNLTIFVEGGNDNRYGTLYPHNSHYDGPTAIHGKRVDTYNVLTESAVLQNSVQGTGTITHEYLHSMGYPDLYEYSGDGTPVGNWDIMSQTSTFLTYPLAYMRSVVSGWNTVDTTTENGTYSLSSFETDPDKQAMILKSPLSDTEFFVVEFRKKGTDINSSLDYKINGSGLIIYRVNTAYDTNSAGQRYIYVLRPNESQVNTDVADAYLSKEANRTTYGSADFTKTATESTLAFSDGSNSGIVISNVGSAEGDSISFDVTFPDTSDVGAWDTVGGSAVSTQDVSGMTSDVDSKGNVYVAFQENASSQSTKLVVKKYNGTAWEACGSINDYGSTPVLKVVNDVPYILYSDSTNWKANLRYWTGSSWSTAKVVSQDSSQDFAMEASGSKIYMLLNEAGSNNKSVIYAFDTSTKALSQIKELANVSYGAGYSLCEKDGEIYLAYRDAFASDKIFAGKLTADGNVEYFSELPMKGTPIVKWIGNELYCVVNGGFSTPGVKVFRYENGSWAQVGDALTSSSAPILDVDEISGQIYVLLSRQGSDAVQNTVVLTYENDAWTQSGLSVDTLQVEAGAIRTFENRVYVAYTKTDNNGDNGKAYVKTRTIGEPPTPPAPVTKYKISYELNGGTNDAKNPASYTEADAIILANPTRTGYHFDGWYTGSDCKTKTTGITKGSKGDKTFYAKWTANTYIISFNGNGATSGSMSSMNGCNYGSAYTLTANTFKRTGYSFASWNTKADGSGTTYNDKASVKNLTSTANATITLYAKWTANKYTIAFNGNGSTSGSMSAMTNRNYGSTYALTANAFKRTGYTFIGWNTKADGSGTTYNDKASVKNLTSTANATITLYAKWTANKYTIAFNGNGSTSGSMSAMTNRNYGSAYTLTTNAFKRTGYTFAGWNTKADGRGITYNDKASVKNLTSTANATVTLYAKWKAIEKPVTPPTPVIPVIPPNVSYRTHVQTYGWQDYVSNGETSGTSGESKRLEGINIALSGQMYSGDIIYRTHVQTYGWQDYVSNGEMSGTSGEAKRLEAIQIQLTGELANKYDIYYRVHAQTFGWMGWAKNGQQAGTAGYAKRLEAIQIVIVNKGTSAPGSTDGCYRHPMVQYNVHCQTYGWLPVVSDGAESGTTGQAKRLEGICISLNNQDYGGNIQYRTHIQTYGWESNWRSNGEMSGTSGEAKRLEAIQIQLTDEMAEHFDIYYRVHAQHFGWMGWAKNGEQAGTAGYAYRLESIQIQVVPKGWGAPGSTDGCFEER